MTSEIVTPAVQAWVERTVPGVRVVGTGLRPLAAAALDEGYRWAALQIPVQYLPWTAGYRPTRDVEAALDRIERALSRLPA